MALYLSTTVLFVVCASMIWVTTAFLIDTDCVCVAPLPCTCSDQYIECGYKSLLQVPVFTEHNEQRQYTTLYLNHNQLTSISAYAFHNLSSFKAPAMNIYLSYNFINTIELHAFSGIDDVVTFLDLSNNNLTHLPQALKELSSLYNLLLVDNPLVSLDSTIMASMDNSLTRLTFSTGNFSGYPIQINGLTKLRSLTMNNIQVPILHSTIFHSFENSLNYLTIEYAKFERIPPAICSLKSLKRLTLNHSPNLSRYNASIFDKCTHRMTTVISLTLYYNQLMVFPKVVFPNLQYLDVRYNLLHFIDSTSFMGFSNLISLNIGSNRFTSIPSAINRARNLQDLIIFDNQIDTVEDFDLQRLHRLTYFNSDHNPLVYLSPFAFKHSPLLSTVYLHSTMLGHIPRAILGLKHLQLLNINHGSPIECSCKTMSYLKTWNMSAITIYATCSSGEPVKTFLTTELPKCT